MTNPLLQLKELGQSVWYDNIDRSQLASGQFQRMLDEDGVVGVTANPTIFEKSISSGHAYDEQIDLLIREGKSTNEIYEALIITDIQTVADILRPIYEQTNGHDGYVSLEVSPDLAHDTEATLSEVRRFWKMVNRPNLMIKIPGTSEGLPAILQSLTEGINVNITLIFSIDTYRKVADAYITALEKRNAEGKDISRMASVASFFVSRVDTLVDKLLEDKIKATSDSAEQQKLKSLEGKAAIANARIVYQEFSASSIHLASRNSSRMALMYSDRCGPAQVPRTLPTAMCYTQRNSSAQTPWIRCRWKLSRSSAITVECALASRTTFHRLTRYLTPLRKSAFTTIR